MLSAAIALRIVMAAAGAPPPALWAHVEPIDDAACRRDASPCFVAAEIVVHNDFLVTIWVDSVEIVLSRDRPSTFVRAIDPPLRIRPGTGRGCPTSSSCTPRGTTSCAPAITRKVSRRRRGSRT